MINYVCYYYRYSTTTSTTNTAATSDNTVVCPFDWTHFTNDD